MQVEDVSAFIASCRKRLDDLNAPFEVDGLPDGFDREDTRFKAVALKWNMDRDGQDWPRPTYLPQGDGGYIIFATGCFDRVEGGPHAWAMQVVGERP